MGSRLVRLLLVALIATGVAIPAVLVLTQEKAAAATMVLTVIDGTADVARGAGTFARVGDGHVLSAGDRVRTADQSHAVVTFFDGSTVALEPATTITVVQATAAATGAITIQIEQAIGRTWSSIQQLAQPDSKFELRTPSATAAVRGTGFTTDVLGNGTTTITTTDGIVDVTAQGQTIVVPAGTFTTVQPGAQPTAPAPGPRTQNTLRFGLHSPALLVVVDPIGRACGIVASGPTLTRQVPTCLTTDRGIDPQLVDIPDAQPGTYTIVVESIASGGDFVATASALDAAGALSFNYALSAGGPRGTKFSATLKVDTAASGALTSSGLSKLTLVERMPTRVVVMAGSGRPAASGTPNASIFPPLPRFGFTAGNEVTPAPAAAQSATPLPSATGSSTPTPSPSPTEVAVSEPTRAPTAPPIRTAPPPPPPTATPEPTAAPTPPPTPSPTPAPTPSGPTITGGIAQPGAAMNVTGRGWSTALITISWEDGRPLVQVTANASGDFAVAITVPFDTSAGATYRISASDGQRTATAQVGVYTPSIAVTCGALGSAVTITGSGWPASARYAIRTTLLGTPLSGVGGADGTFTTSFVPPTGTLPGDYPITANVGSLLAETQTCTLR